MGAVGGRPEGEDRAGADVERDGQVEPHPLEGEGVDREDVEARGVDRDVFAGAVCEEGAEILARAAGGAAAALRRAPEEAGRGERVGDDAVEGLPRGGQLERPAALAREPARDPRPELHLAHVGGLGELGCLGQDRLAQTRVDLLSATGAGPPVDQGRDPVALQVAAFLPQPVDRAPKLGRLRLEPGGQRGVRRVESRARLARGRPPGVAGAIAEPGLVQVGEQFRRLALLALR